MRDYYGIAGIIGIAGIAQQKKIGGNYVGAVGPHRGTSVIVGIAPSGIVGIIGIAPSGIVGIVRIAPSGIVGIGDPGDPFWAIP